MTVNALEWLHNNRDEWEWAPGMHPLELDGTPTKRRVEAVSTDRTLLFFGYRPHMSYASLSADKHIPDFSDPATIGCIEDFIRRRLGAPEWSPNIFSNALGWCTDYIEALDHKFFATKTELLIAILEAL